MSLDRTLWGVSITSDGTRIVAAGAGGAIWRSTDGGSTFAKIQAASADLLAVGFMEDLPAQGWAVGVTGTIVHTSNGGANWEKLDTPLVVDYTAIEDFN